jgi:hypothetical protein
MDKNVSKHLFQKDRQTLKISTHLVSMTPFLLHAIFLKFYNFLSLEKSNIFLMPHSNKDIYHYYYFDIFNVCLSFWNRCLDTFNNTSVISWRSVLLVEETGGPGENHWPRAPDNVQVQRVIIPYFWKWLVFAYFLCTHSRQLYSLLQKRLLTCILLKLSLTQVLFNKHRMQVKCISLFNLTRLCHVY